jgi:hypothetical protein
MRYERCTELVKFKIPLLLIFVFSPKIKNTGITPVSVAVGPETLSAGDEVWLVATVLVMIVAVCPVDPLT